MDATAYCPACGERTDFIPGSRKENNTVRGIYFEYAEVFARCGRCGKEVYVPEINDLNVDAREAAFRAAFYSKEVPK